jgi:AcrR family transcriptional regulator
MNVHLDYGMNKGISEKRRVILNTTLRLITEYGFDATPVSLIAKEAGIAAGTIYLYFPSKNEMVQALYLELKEELTSATLKGFTFAMHGRDAIEHLLNNYLQFMLNNPVKFKFFELFTSSPYIDKLTKEAGLKIFYQIFEVFEQAKQENLIKNISNQILYAQVFAPMHFLVRQHISQEIVLTDENRKIAYQACWDAIKSSN